MASTLEREVAREVLPPPVRAPEPPSRRRVRFAWTIGVILVIALAVGWWATSADDEFSLEDFAAAEDALATIEVTPVPAPGWTWQEFAEAEDALLAPRGWTWQEFAAAEDAPATAHATSVPDPGWTWQEFAEAEDRIGR